MSRSSLAVLWVSFLVFYAISPAMAARQGQGRLTCRLFQINAQDHVSIHFQAESHLHADNLSVRCLAVNYKIYTPSQTLLYSWDGDGAVLSIPFSNELDERRHLLIAQGALTPLADGSYFLVAEATIQEGQAAAHSFTSPAMGFFIQHGRAFLPKSPQEMADLEEEDRALSFVPTDSSYEIESRKPTTAEPPLPSSDGPFVRHTRPQHIMQSPQPLNMPPDTQKRVASDDHSGLESGPLSTKAAPAASPDLAVSSSQLTKDNQNIVVPPLPAASTSEGVASIVAPDGSAAAKASPSAVPLDRITVTGHVLIPELQATGAQVFLSLYGAAPIQTQLDPQSNGTFQFHIPNIPGDIIAVYVNNGAHRGAHITVTKGGHIPNLDISPGVLDITLDANTHLKHQLLALMSANNNPLLLGIYSVDSNNRLSTASTVEFRIHGGRYTPEGDIATPSLTLNANTFVAGSSVIDIGSIHMNNARMDLGQAHIRLSGNWTASSSAVDPGQSTVELIDGTTSTLSADGGGTMAFHDLVFSKPYHSGIPGLITLSNPIDIRGDFTIGQTLDVIHADTITLYGDLIPGRTLSGNTGTMHLLGTLIFKGDQDQRVRGCRGYPSHIVIDKPGGILALEPSSWFFIEGDWTHIQGEVRVDQGVLIGFLDRENMSRPGSMGTAVVSHRITSKGAVFPHLLLRGICDIVGSLNVNHLTIHGEVNNGSITVSGKIQIFPPASGNAEIICMGSDHQDLAFFYDSELIKAGDNSVNFSHNLTIDKPLEGVTLMDSASTQLDSNHPLVMTGNNQHIQILRGQLNLNGHDIRPGSGTNTRLIVGGQGHLILQGHERLPALQLEAGSRVTYTGSAWYTEPAAGYVYHHLGITGGLIGYWDFEDSDPKEALDRSGLSHNIDLVHLNSTNRSSDTPPLVSFPNTQSLSLNQQDGHDFVTLIPVSHYDPETALFLSRTGRPTTLVAAISFWFKTSKETAQCLLSHLNGFNVTLVNSHQLSFHSQRMYTSSPVVIPTPNVADGEWHHLVIIRDHDPFPPKIRIVLDGIEVFATQALLAPRIYGSLTLGLSRTLNTDGSIRTENPFVGDIDDLRIYNTPLSPSQITELANGRHPSLAGGIELHKPLTVNGDLLLNGQINTNGHPLTVFGQQEILTGVLNP